ncbi:hypothetical protein P7M58_24450 [Vibrio parahaemolyticus]|nr:hypothetical protein [Vibrio parahaemolyticus]
MQEHQYCVLHPLTGRYVFYSIGYFKYGNEMLFINEINELSLWISSQSESISLSFVQNLINICGVGIAIYVIRKTWLILNRLRPLSTEEFELLNSVINSLMTLNIHYMESGTISADELSINEQETEKYLKAISKLKRKFAIEEITAFGGCNQTYKVTNYGKTRFERSKKLSKF